MYISDPKKLIEYILGTVGWYSNHQNKYFGGFGVLGVIFVDFLKMSNFFSKVDATDRQTYRQTTNVSDSQCRRNYYHRTAIHGLSVALGQVSEEQIHFIDVSFKIKGVVFLIY